MLDIQMSQFLAQCCTYIRINHQLNQMLIELEAAANLRDPNSVSTDESYASHSFSITSLNRLARGLHQARAQQAESSQQEEEATFGDAAKCLARHFSVLQLDLENAWLDTATAAPPDTKLHWQPTIGVNFLHTSNSGDLKILDCQEESLNINECDRDSLQSLLIATDSGLDENSNV